MATGRTGLWLVLALACAWAPGVAQEAPRPVSPGLTYHVSGTVVDLNGVPLVSAEVVLVERDTATRVARTDADGRFRMDSLTEPTSLFRVRRLGFQPKLVQVRFTSNSRAAIIVVSLEPAAANLDTVLVDADTEVVKPDMRLVAFYERVKTNSFGRYITEEMLAKQKPRYTSEAVQSVPGATLRPSRRGGNIVRLRNCGVRGESVERAGPLVWLDGVRLPGAELDEVTTANDVAAIEVYNSFAGVPVQFFDRTAVCGTILVWTKSH